jgi:hypothetical protein
MKPRPTGNELFDIFWKEYPPRINGAGVTEKRKKGLALKWFEKEKPSEEKVYDMLAWIKKDKECRKTSEDANKFYSPPPDAIVFLNQKRWMDEIGEVLTKTDRREAHRSRSVYSNNVQSLISQCQGIIKEWPIQKLLKSPVIRAGRKYPEFRAWAIEQRPDLKGAKADKADNPPLSQPVNAVVKKSLTTQIPSDADLPPPRDDDFTGQSKLVDDFVEKYNLFENNS